MDAPNALVRALTRAEAAAAEAEAQAVEARHVLAVTLYHLAKGASRRWMVPAERVAAAAGVAALEWNRQPDGGIEVRLDVTEEAKNGDG